MIIYTREDWNRDRSFSAEPGQEIEEEIYWEMFDCMPPYRLPRPRAGLSAGFSCGFLMGEPHSFDPVTHKTLYLAFGRRDGRCYFLGLLPSDGRE